MNPTPTISIILPVYNDQENLNRVLSEFANNQQDGSWEIIVVDDGSTKPVKVAETLLGKGQLIQNPTNQGVAVARNAGIRKARGEYVVLLSVFLRIQNDYVKKLKQFIESNKFDFAQHLIQARQSMESTKFQQFIGAHADRIGSSPANLSITNCQFAAAVIKKETLVAVRGFDESMQHYGGHELDLIYRLDQAGYKKRVLISDIVLQRVKLEDHKSIQERLREYGQIGLPNLLKKHPELTRVILKKPTIWFILAFVGIPYWLENRISHQIEANQPLSLFTYRLYLHLLMRNAWDAR